MRFVNDSVSDNHAAIERTRDGEFRLHDLDALNGTFLNGNRVRSSPLREGDLIELGEVRIRFSIPDSGDKEVPPRLTNET